ncbi:DUF4192 domain-containing protein [Micromonospora sp. CPCC 206060]|uniref:DUF4192 domain-containing protein n=1 Tax=Micromonospora sp. CPCC 206060 TaxID=3122406 RepID=UPI002FEFE1E8
MTSTEKTVLSVRSPADLIAAVPYLLGFHPTDSVVVVAMRGKRVVFAARGDLPAAGLSSSETARYISDMIFRQDAGSATVLGYGPADRVTPAVDAVRVALEAGGLRVLDVLRVTDGRYWSYLCPDPGCCPPEGRPYDAGSSEVTAAAVFAGEVAYPDRASLAAEVAPVGGLTRIAMRQATVRAEERMIGLLDEGPLDERKLNALGDAAVRAALDPGRAPGSMTDDEVAWLTMLLAHLPIRDQAWELTDGDDRHLALWRYVVQRAEPELVPAPACLLAFAAWRAGRGSLAVVALERALTVEPDYSMALLLDELIRNGVPPSQLDGWPKIAGAGAGAGAGASGRRRRRSRADRRRRPRG